MDDILEMAQDNLVEITWRKPAPALAPVSEEPSVLLSLNRNIEVNAKQAAKRAEERQQHNQTVLQAYQIKK